MPGDEIQTSLSPSLSQKGKKNRTGPDFKALDYIGVLEHFKNLDLSAGG